MSLDHTDIRLITELQANAKLTTAELSELIHLSPSACHRRVQRLEQEGYIKGYVALGDARKLGRPSTVFVEISLNTQADEVLADFEREVAKVPAVLECHLMTGRYDYLLKVVARDTEEFAEIHRRYLARLPGVATLQSSFALKTVFKTTAIPVK